MKGITGRTPNKSTLVGTLQRDRLGWKDHIKIGGFFVRFWIYDELAKFPVGKKVRLTIEVIP